VHTQLGQVPGRGGSADEEDRYRGKGMRCQSAERTVGGKASHL